jgi:hypothetical protein
MPENHCGDDVICKQEPMEGVEKGNMRIVIFIE